MIRSQVVLFFVVLSLLFSSCGAIERLPPEPVEEADHNLAIIAPAASLATATPLPRHYLPFLYVPKASPTPTPTITPTKRPVSDGHTFPPYSTSLYLKTVDGSALYNM